MIIIYHEGGRDCDNDDCKVCLFFFIERLMSIFYLQETNRKKAESTNKRKKKRKPRQSESEGRQTKLSRA